MTSLPEDPLSEGGIKAYGERLRTGRTTASATVRAYLDRIEKLDGKLGAFEHVAIDQALGSARNVDDRLSTGDDAGPLMGVPVVLKDLIAIDGMPLTAGSNIDVRDLVGPEGRFVRKLRRAGCILLGKSKTAEFARGGSGISRLRGTPWNPWDSEVHRAPGGSSSGSAVAMAAGLCGFAVGTDTGGSVRAPAALCGVFGQKTTHGLWALDGVYPNAHSFDTIGTMTRSAEDAAMVFSVLSGQAVPQPPAIDRLRFGIPADHFFDDLDSDVAACIGDAVARLKASGATTVSVRVPEANERKTFVDTLCAPEFIANFGRDRFVEMQDRMDPLTVERAKAALAIPATEYVAAQRRQQALRQEYSRRMAELDAWLAPTVRTTAPAVAPAMQSMAATIETEGRLGLNTHLVSYFGLCATTTPLRHSNAPLPIGLQSICAGDADARALSIALSLEDAFGKPVMPDMANFE